MDAVQDDTKAVIVDASAMGSVDVTAAKTLRIMYDTHTTEVACFQTL